jgi:AbrB family looped-hinge helix DNA binding protein
MPLNSFDSFYIILSMIAEITKLTNGNSVVIPAAIRKSLGLQVGDTVTLVLQDNGEVSSINSSGGCSASSSLSPATCFC